ncbi:hypothetical protein D3I19_RS09040 [Enterococcus hirae]
MARSVLEAMDMDTLTKGRYVQLLARGYSPKDVFKALAKGTDMEKDNPRLKCRAYVIIGFFIFAKNREGRKTHEL